MKQKNIKLKDELQKKSRGYSDSDVGISSDEFGENHKRTWSEWFGFSKGNEGKAEGICHEPMGCKTVKCCLGLVWVIIKTLVIEGWRFCVNPLKATGNEEEEFAILNSIWFSRSLGFLTMFIIYQVVAFVLLEIKKIGEWLKWLFGRFLSLPGFTLFFIVMGFLGSFIAYMLSLKPDEKLKEDPRLKKMEEEIKKVKLQIKKKEEDKKFEKMEKDLEALYAQLGVSFNGNQPQTQEAQTPQPAQNPVVVKKVPKQVTSQWRCGRCHQMGHTVRDCKAKNPAPGAIPSRLCFICQGKHFVNDCPNRRRDVATVDQFEGAQNPMESADVAQAGEETEDCLALTSPSGQKCRVLAAFGEPPSEAEVLIDSGATINGIGLNDLIKMDLANKLEVRAGAVAAFNGTQVPFLGTIDIKLGFSVDHSEVVSFVVFHHLACPILGTPGIMKFGGQLKFTESGISFETGQNAQQCFAMDANHNGGSTSQIPN